MDCLLTYTIIAPAKKKKGPTLSASSKSLTIRIARMETKLTNAEPTRNLWY